MSKIICDVCGTTYPETSTHCPICGCVRPGDAKVVNGDTNEPEATGNGNYTYVKGGRFSKSNVKKRSRVSQVVPAETTEKNDSQKGKGKETGMAIAVIALLLAIVAVVIYIAMRFFDPFTALGGGASTTTQENTTNTEITTDNTTETSESTVLDIPCTELTVSKSVIEFEKAGAALLLNVTKNPADTTDEVVFASADENVAIVSQDGKVTSVAPGQTVITITCGQAAAECRVVCTFEVETTEPSEDATDPSEEATEPSSEPETDTKAEIKLNWYYTMAENPEVGDVTLTVGEKWTAYLDGEGKVKSTQIVFSTSDSSVIVIDNTGVATAVGAGEAYVYAEYNGQKVKCRVMVR